MSPEAATSIHEDGIVILDLSKGLLFGSNDVGARIWRGVQQRLSLDAIAEMISREYGVACAEVREHVAAFLSQLERHALVERAVA